MAKLRMASYNMLGGNTMKKFKFIFSVCIILSLTVLSQLNVFAMSDATSDDSISVDISDTSLNSQDDAKFNEDVAKDDAFSNLVVQSAQHKGKNISLDGVHPGKNIKLYGIKGSENILQSLYDSYTATGTMQNMISADYAVLKLYVNKNNEYVDSLVFTKQENLPSAKGKNGWVELCSGSMVLKDDFIVKYSQDRNLKKYVTDLGLKNTKNLKIISSIPNMPVSIYFVQENNGNIRSAQQAYFYINGISNLSKKIIKYVFKKLNSQEKQKNIKANDIFEARMIIEKELSKETFE